MLINFSPYGYAGPKIPPYAWTILTRIDPGRPRSSRIFNFTPNGIITRMWRSRTYRTQHLLIPQNPVCSSLDGILPLAVSVIGIVVGYQHSSKSFSFQCSDVLLNHDFSHHQNPLLCGSAYQISCKTPPFIFHVRKPFRFSYFSGIVSDGSAAFLARQNR